MSSDPKVPVQRTQIVEERFPGRSSSSFSQQLKLRPKQKAQLVYASIPSNSSAFRVSNKNKMTE